MKRILSLFLVLILISLSMITVVAMELLPPNEYIEIYFEILYKTVDDDFKIVTNNSTVNDIYVYSDQYDYAVVKYTSNNPLQEPYFNRFGANNEYYEYSEVTNLLFESGITVFRGTWHLNPENRPEHHNDDFYSLDEIAQLQPLVIEQVQQLHGPERVGYIGDSDCDGEVTILDATSIQRHLAQLDTLKITDMWISQMPQIFS